MKNVDKTNDLMKTRAILFGIIFILAGTLARAQETADTVIVELAKTSRVIFTVKDRSDLEILKHYDFQQLFQDVIVKLESKDSTALATRDSLSDDDDDLASRERDDDNDWWEQGRSNDNDDNEWDKQWHHHNRWGRTWQSFNFDLGTNNYLQDGKFPDSDNALYSVRPWGSWYVAGSSIQRTRLSSKLFVEWGLGLSWYNFKFQKDNVTILKDDACIQFVADTQDVNFKIRKLSASYVHASLVPILDFSGHSRKSRIWEGDNNSFRSGVGPYVAYRISSHTKLVYNDGGREKD